MAAAEWPGLDTSRPHPARVYDYLLGGTDHFAADRAAGDRIIAALPAVQDGVRAQRAVLGRAVRYLVAEAGIGQLLDIGSGLPTADNVHQIAQRIDPAVRVVYVDNDPVVLVEPGLVPVPRWHPEPGTPDGPEPPVLGLACAGLARKG